MKTLRRLTILTILAALTIVPMARGSGIAHADSSTAGTWSTLSYFRCIPNDQNKDICNGQDSLIINPLFATVDSAGNFTDDASILYTEIAPGAGPLCSPQLFSTPFTGTCIVSDFGSGSVKPGSAGPADFTIADETATFHSSPPQTMHLPFPPYPIDTGTPATPVSIDTAQALGLSAGQTPPPGVTIEAIVAHGTGPGFPAVALPLAPSANGSGTSYSFAVAFYSPNGGQGMVLFGPARAGCSGLVEVATNDVFSGAKAHTVVVTGNDLPGTAGNNGVQPGTTYSYETVVITSSGIQVDDNGGKCYSITMPAA